MRKIPNSARFDYHDGCPIPHHVPEGWIEDGKPVIIFPAREWAVEVGELYPIFVRLTHRATYVKDGVTYRVAHASLYVSYTHMSAKEEPKSTLADALDPELAERLKAMAAG